MSCAAFLQQFYRQLATILSSNSNETINELQLNYRSKTTVLSLKNNKIIIEKQQNYHKVQQFYRRGWIWLGKLQQFYRHFATVLSFVGNLIFWFVAFATVLLFEISTFKNSA